MYRVNEKVAALINRFKQPEYTGENRCFPCTVLNTAIALAGTIVLAVISPIIAITAFVVAMGIIGLRGYLVPGTPTLVTYLPDWVHNRIGPGSHQDPLHEEETAQSNLAVEETLKQARIIEECDDVDDVCLTDEFESDWQLALDHFGTRPNQRARLAETLDIAPETISFEKTDSGFFVHVGDVRAGRWLSEAAFIVDLASEQVLSTGLPTWEQYQDAERTELLVALRTFVERCPSCGGVIDTDESVRRSCCRENIVTVDGVCSACNATIFTGNVS